MIDSGHSPAYRQYLKSPAWKDRRRTYYAQHGYYCQACGKRPQRKRWWQFWLRADWLQVHHMSYEVQRRSPGHEPDGDLICLCRPHHEESHARHRAGQFGGHEGSLRAATMHVVNRERRLQERRQAKLAKKATKAQ